MIDDPVRHADPRFFESPYATQLELAGHSPGVVCKCANAWLAPNTWMHASLRSGWKDVSLNPLQQLTYFPQISAGENPLPSRRV